MVNAAFWAWAVVSGVCAGLVDIDAVELGYRQSLPMGRDENESSKL